jgi:glycosyltransferase involved in cell wall biosynthesis
LQRRGVKASDGSNFKESLPFRKKNFHEMHVMVNGELSQGSEPTIYTDPALSVPRPSQAQPILSVIVPAYNEEGTIETVLHQLHSLPFVKEIIVVDDCSTDRTNKRVKEMGLPKIHLLSQDHNSGKSAAVKRGLQEVTGEITIIQDADLEYDPCEIESVIQPILENKADAVYGSRFLVRKASRVLYFYHYIGNRILTFFSNLLTNVNMTDIETGYKAARTPLLRMLPLSSSGFGLEVEITALLTSTKARLYEVPISYYGRTYEEGKKIGTIDGLFALWYILYYNTLGLWSRNIRGYIRQANSYLDSLPKS